VIKGEGERLFEMTLKHAESIVSIEKKEELIRALAARLMTTRLRYRRSTSNLD